MEFLVSKTDLDDFIENNELNWSIYETLITIEGELDSQPIDALDTFNYAYSAFENLKNDKQPQETVLDYKSSINFYYGYDYFHTEITMECLRVIIVFSNLKDPKYDLCVKRIKDKTPENLHYYFDSLITQKAEIQSLDQEFEEIKKSARNEKDRVNFYKSVIKRFKRRNIRPDIVEKIEKQIETEIECNTLYERANNIVVNGIKSLKETNKHEEETKAPSKKRVNLSETKGMRVDFIRVINVLCELGFFVDSQGKKSTKKDVFATFGECVNRDFKNYQNDLSTTQSAANADMNSLTKIFRDMLEKQELIISKKQ